MGQAGAIGARHEDTVSRREVPLRVEEAVDFVAARGRMECSGPADRNLRAEFVALVAGSGAGKPVAPPAPGVTPKP